MKDIEVEDESDYLPYVREVRTITTPAGAEVHVVVRVHSWKAEAESDLLRKGAKKLVEHIQEWGVESADEEELTRAMGLREREQRVETIREALVGFKILGPDGEEWSHGDVADVIDERVFYEQ